MAWLGFSWGKEGRAHEDGEERQRRMELHEKELFELQRLKEQEELRKKKIIEKSVNSVLDLLERKKEELENKEIVLRELMIIHANEKKELEEEFITKQRHQEDKQREEIENLDEEKERLRTELDQLEVSLEDLMTSGVTTEEIKDNFLPCPECPVFTDEDTSLGERETAEIMAKKLALEILTKKLADEMLKEQHK